ncbi:MAG: hypothetical protein K9K37_09610 [Desulfocapsa sp.]|nr:hypothetical protein [Desulfocapsa sp.]
MKKSKKYFEPFKSALLSGAVVSSVLILLLSTGVAHSGVPADQLPVPYEQLRFINNVFDISGWPATKTLHSVGIEGEYLYFPNDGACSWASTDGIVNTNVHIVLEYKGEWLASSWDYTRICQQSKHYDAIGDIPYLGWKPQAGVTYYFFLTGVSRDKTGGDVEERTNVVAYKWFGPTGYPPPVCEGAPVINNFSATQYRVMGGPGGLLGEEKDYNVLLTWDIGNADSVALVRDNGMTVESNFHPPVVSGLELLINKTSTFTISASNECTADKDSPSKTLTVTVTQPNLPALNLLLSDKPAD